MPRMAGRSSSVKGGFQVSDMKLKMVEDRGVQEESKDELHKSR